MPSQADPFSFLPSVEFAQPLWLLLIPVLCALSWWIARGAIGGWHGGRRVVHLLLRCAVIVLLCLGLAEPSVRRPASDVAVIVVRDVSRSVPLDQQRLAGQFLAASLRHKAPADQIGVVSAAEDAFVQSLPTSGGSHAEAGSYGPIDGTDLQTAVRLARSMIPAGAGGRLLVISDGRETRGSLLAAAAEAQAARVPIDVAVVEYDRGRTVRVKEVAVPSWARQHDAVDARVVIESGRETGGRLSLSINGELVDLDPDAPGLSREVDLTSGLNVLSIPLRLSEAAVHRIEASFEPDTDSGGQGAAPDAPELLRATGVIFTSSRGRVLVLSEDEAAMAPLLDAIGSMDLVIETRPASAAPASLAELAGYDAVVLANQPAFNFSQAQQQELVRYVHDTGGGLLVLGGPESYGAGGWMGSPLADALPVQLDPPQKRQMPMGALALVIDRSGSMSQTVAGTSLNQQQVANESAILGVRALSRLDHVTVIAFSDGEEVVVPLTLCAEADEIARRIRSIGPGGGTNLFPAIDAAAAQLEKSPAGVKHIIVLTDGQTIGNPSAGLAKVAALKRRGVTVSTVAIGDSSNDNLLMHLSHAGGGRWYGVTSADSLAILPQIFIKEAQTVRRALIWEGPPFSPSVSVGGGSIRGISGPFPPTTGYVVTGDRGGLSTVGLRGHEGDPILAQWQYGLGRVTAFTSDATTRWNAAWTPWSAFGAFWTQQLHWTMRPTGDPLARVSIQQQGERARVIVELHGSDGERLNFANVRGRVIHPGGASTGGEIRADDLVLRQVGPGLYEGEVETIDPGVHIVALRYDAPGADGARQGSVRAAIVRAPGEELSEPTPDATLLAQAARQTNGRIYRLQPSGVDLWAREGVVMPVLSRAIWQLIALVAVAMFLADVAARRIAIDPERIRRWTAGLLAAAPAKLPGSLSNLADAKARSAAAMPKHVSPTPPEPGAGPDGGKPPSPLTEGDLVLDPAPPASAAPQPPDAAGATDSPSDTLARLRAAKRRSHER